MRLLSAALSKGVFLIIHNFVPLWLKIPCTIKVDYCMYLLYINDKYSIAHKLMWLKVVWHCSKYRIFCLTCSYCITFTKVIILVSSSKAEYDYRVYTLIWFQIIIMVFEKLTVTHIFNYLNKQICWSRQLSTLCVVWCL